LAKLPSSSSQNGEQAYGYGDNNDGIEIDEIDDRDKGFSSYFTTTAAGNEQPTALPRRQ
jgi:hypothetical protein